MSKTKKPGAKAVNLTAVFRRLDSKSLRSGDKGVSLTFEIDNPSDETMDLLNRLQDPQREVNLGIWR
ncbi:MAG: hypothetical protein WC130_11715 [Kiritimatiellia bacterium]|jgi:hypothetical protein